MANYAVEKKVLTPYLPHKTELDVWNDVCYVSLVGFMFLNTKVKGISVPFHTNFEEVNLRFYVRYRDNGEWKRGVVFIKEIVPMPMLSFVANTIYRENYETMPMQHSWETIDGTLRVAYKWKNKKWNSLSVTANSKSKNIEDGSEEEFITEHYLGYTRINDERTSEYGVEHPRWEVYNLMDYSIDVDFSDIYGQDFEFLDRETPVSVFLAEGSEIKVKAGRMI